MSAFMDELDSKFDGKYNYIRVNKVDVDRNKGTAEIVLLYPYEKEGEFLEKDRLAIDKWLRFMLPKKLKIDIVFRKSYIDEEVLLRKVKEYFRVNLRTIYSQLHDEDFKVKLDDRMHVKIAIGPTFYDFLVEQEKIVDTLTHFLEHNFTLSAEVEVTKKEEDREFVFEGEDKVFEFNRREIPIKEKEQGQIVGKGITQNAMYIADIKSPIEEVVICGKMENFERKIAKKNGRIYYTFTLNDTTGKIACKYFTKTEKSGPLDGMEDGMEVAILGRADDDTFIKGLAVNVRRMSYVTIDYDSISLETASNILYDHYITVEPEKYVDMTQQDFFTMDEDPIIDYLVGKSYVVFDFETTGLDEKKARPIELGALKIRDGVKVETFSTLINPEIAIPEEVIGITHIDDDMVKGAPLWKEVVADFYKFTRGCKLVGHNVKYDYNILTNNSKDLGYKFENELVDTCALAGRFIRGQANNKLITLCNFLGISLEGAHRALNDVLATADLFEYIVKHYYDEK